MKAALIAIFAIFLQIFVLTASETVVVTSVHDGDSFRGGESTRRSWISGGGLRRGRRFGSC